jgi:hypothetical protein
MSFAAECAENAETEEISQGRKATRATTLVIPAKARIRRGEIGKDWIPAFAGMANTL